MTKNIKIVTNKEACSKVNELVSKYAKGGLFTRPVVCIFIKENGNVEIGFKCNVRRVNALRKDVTQLTNDFRMKIGA
jgi:hypothetical protein